MFFNNNKNECAIACVGKGEIVSSVINPKLGFGTWNISV